MEGLFKCKKKRKWFGATLSYFFLLLLLGGVCMHYFNFSD